MNTFTVPVYSNGAISVIPPVNTGIRFGQIATSANTLVKVLKNAYTEQTTNAQRSFVSSSANDTSAGTGARTLLLTYYDQNMAGPFTETITMNGVSNVNTVSSTICFVESIVVATTGSGLTNAGTITMKAAAAGGGATITTLSAGDNRTLWAQHYVGVGLTCYITAFRGCSNTNGATAGAITYINKVPLGLFELQISGKQHYIGNVGTIQVAQTMPIQVVGPAKIIQYVIPESATANTMFADFDFYEITTPG